jgi:hypothetical protein
VTRTRSEDHSPSPLLLGQKLFSLGQHGKTITSPFEADCDKIRIAGIVFPSFDNSLELAFVDCDDNYKLIGWEIQCSSIVIENSKDYFELPQVFGEHRDILSESAKWSKLQKFDWRIGNIEKGEGLE